MSDTGDLDGVYASFCSGNCPDADERVLAILRATTDDLVAANCAAVLASIGFAKRNSDLIEYAIGLLDRVREKLAIGTPSMVYYNLASCWRDLHYLQHRSPGWIDAATSSALRRALAYGRKAVDVSRGQDAETPVSYLINMANTLDSSGRGLEAIEAYDRVLTLDPTCGMALCNKALAIHCFAQLATAYRDVLYVLAYQMLRQGLADAHLDTLGEAGARQHFMAVASAIRDRAPMPEYLDRLPSHPPADLKGASDTKKVYVELCSREHLFLNVHIHDSTCDAAIMDNMFPGSTHGRVLGSQDKTLLQIIEDYSCARFIWVLSQISDEGLTSIGALTHFPRVRGVALGLPQGLMKAAFRLGFDILDKIGVFVNDHLSLGMREQRVHFAQTALWHGTGTDLRPEIARGMGPGLAALYSIFLDFQTEQPTQTAHLGHLRVIRNALTHRRLLVARTEAGQSKTDEHIGSEELKLATRDMLFLSRCAIMYLMLFVDWRDRTKSAP